MTRTVFFDVDTQLDFLFPAGALYVPGAEQIAPAIARLTQSARERGIPIVSTMDTHLEDDSEFKIWKPHCVAGTQGWQKYAPTLVGQTLFEKNTIDFFENEKLHRLLDELAAERFVVYGLATEHCVRSALFGLLRRRAKVYLVEDAVKSLDTKREDDVTRLFLLHGGHLRKAEDIVLWPARDLR